jgi:hypothetical protein
MLEQSDLVEAKLDAPVARGRIERLGEPGS